MAVSISFDLAIRSAPFCRISAKKSAGSGLEGGLEAVDWESEDRVEGAVRDEAVDWTDRIDWESSATSTSFDLAIRSAPFCRISAKKSAGGR